MKQIVVFDLDGTLAVSKQPLDPSMANLLSGLLQFSLVCIISGGDWPQFERQVVSQLPKVAKLENLILMPTTGAKLYRYAEGWKLIYADSFEPAVRNSVVTGLKSAVIQKGLVGDKLWGEQIEDRGTQITFSGLGQAAPPDAKSRWDPDQKKRAALKALLDAQFPNLSIRIGGSTSIDITKPGVDKGYGVRQLSDYTGVHLNDMLFVGDALYPGGNDAPARDAGVPTVGVRSIEDSRLLIDVLTKFAG